MIAAELMWLIENDSWCRVRMRGSHRQYTHPEKPGVLTLRRQPLEEIAPAALQGVLRQAGVQP